MITAHALDRISKRMGYRSGSAARIAENAFVRGVAPDNLPSKERDYLKKQEQKAGCVARFYNGYCFIFNSDGTCITAYLPPKWFGRKPYYIGKQRVRDHKKYSQRYDVHVDLKSFNIEEVMAYGV